MKVNLVVIMFVLDSEKNDNIRKNDIKKIKLLVNNKLFLPTINYETNDMKDSIRKYFSKVIGSDVFHLEQVYTYGYVDKVDILYLGIINIENIKKLSSEYKLIDFNVFNNEIITLGENRYKYKTIEKVNNNSIEYFHNILVDDENLKCLLMYVLISYKRIRSNIDNTDILFKFLGNTFTLEDARIVYELIKDSSVDKSNFRKKIIKYCEKVLSVKKDGNGFRPSQRYKFKPLKGDVWL